MTKTHKWSVSYGSGGFEANLIKIPTWAAVLDTAMEYVLEATGHKICCNIPEAAWKIPLSEETYEDGSPKESLGSALYDMTAKIETFLWNQEEEITSIPISDDTARILSPKFASELLDALDEEE